MKYINKEEQAKFRQAVAENKDIEKYTVKVMKALPTRTNRLASRLYANQKRMWLEDYRPGKLTRRMQQLVVAHILRRETNERIYIEGKKGGDATPSV